MNKNDGHIDDLTAIKGIGPARQRWLREVLNVHTFSDLAALSIDEVESRLKEEGQIVSRNEIKSWIVAAKERVAEAVRSRRLNESAEIETITKPESLVPEAEWNSIAAFFVQLQIRKAAEEKVEQRITVKHIPIAENGTWLEEDPKKEPIVIEDGRQGERLYEWMQAQLIPELRNKSQYSVSTAAISSDQAQPLKVNVTSICLFRPSHFFVQIGFSETGKIIDGFIKGNEMFNIEVSFVLSCLPGFNKITKDTEYKVRCYASNRSTGEQINLGDTVPAPLSKDRLAYAKTLSEVSLPPGFYRLQVIAELRGSVRSLGYFEIPFLQVGEVSVPHRIPISLEQG